MGNEKVRRKGIARYWPVAVVVALAAAGLGAGALVGGDDEDEPAAASGSRADGPPALAAFGDEDPLDAPDCDPETGRLAVPTVYAPNCVPIWPDDRDNGGATSPGVTEDEIVVAFYNAQASATATAITDEVVGDEAVTEEQEEEYRQVLVEMYNALYETYGRTVRLVTVEASGEAADDAAARADAIRIADDIGAFAAIGGPSQTNAYADELAARGVVCLCMDSQPIESYEEWAPYVWGGLMASTQGYVHRADYIAERLAGEPAEFAGDPSLQSEERSFAIVYSETADGTFTRGVDFFEERLGQADVELADRIPYTLDLSRAPEDAGTVVARLKDAGITSVIFAGDGFFPIYLTQEATNQDYFPEWIITGSALTDTSALARRYDQQQWAHAFGISFLTARVHPDVAAEEGNLLTWYADDEFPVAAYASITTIGRLFTGIHLAGPDLTPETLRDAFFAFDPTSGYTTAFASSYGEGLWPWTDYTSADDVTEIWWDAEATGPDELGADGTGLYRYANGGRRYLPGEIGESTATPFDEDGTVTVLDALPEGDRPPDYPRRTSRTG